MFSDDEYRFRREPDARRSPTTACCSASAASYLGSVAALLGRRAPSIRSLARPSLIAHPLRPERQPRQGSRDPAAGGDGRRAPAVVPQRPRALPPGLGARQAVLRERGGGRSAVSPLGDGGDARLRALTVPVRLVGRSGRTRMPSAAAKLARRARRSHCGGNAAHHAGHAARRRSGALCRQHRGVRKTSKRRAPPAIGAVTQLVRAGWCGHSCSTVALPSAETKLDSLLGELERLGKGQLTDRPLSGDALDERRPALLQRPARCRARRARPTTPQAGDRDPQPHGQSGTATTLAQIHFVRASERGARVRPNARCARRRRIGSVSGIYRGLSSHAGGALARSANRSILRAPPRHDRDRASL